MRYRTTFIAIVLSVVAFAGWASTALAGQYTPEKIPGTPMPSWVDVLPSVNDAGDVAWTSMATSPTSFSAHLYAGSSDSVLPGPSGQDTYALDITESIGGVVRIAGATASDVSMIDQRAVLWTVDTGSASPIAQPLDLASAAEQTLGHPVAQSKAYSVIVDPNDATKFLVGGFVRQKVSNKYLPQPVIWTVNTNGSGSVSVAKLTPYGGSAGYGIVTSIASNPDTGNLWACGNSLSAAGVYVQAACWNITTGISGVSPYGQLQTDMKSTPGFGAGVVTNAVQRVRTVPIGSSGTQHTVVVGMAMTNSGGAVWHGYIYDLDTGDFYKDFSITPDTDTVVYDVAGLNYVQEDANATRHGMVVAGISATGGSGWENAGPTGINTKSFRGVKRAMLLSGVTDTGKVCAINDDTGSPVGPGSTYQQLVALSRNGNYRVALDNGGSLYLLTWQHDDGVTVNINVRDVKYRHRGDQGPQAIQKHYYVLETPNPPAGSTAALLRLGSSLSCDAVDQPNPVAGRGLGATCNNGTPATFDINPGYQHKMGTAGGSNSLHSSQQTTGSLLTTPPTAPYAQVAFIDSSNNCSVTPVKSLANIQRIVNPADDFNGDTTPWRQCGGNGYDANINVDYDNCGSCGHSASSDLPNNVASCTVAECSNGSGKVFSINNNHCVISNACYADGDRSNDTTTAYRRINTINTSCGNSSSFPTYLDPCRPVCDSSTSQTAWTPYTNAACCTSGTARLDIYDTQQSHCNDTQWSYDHNDGRVRSARWKDPRSGWIYTQDDDWSSGDLNTCYANGSGNPHSIINPGTVNRGYARPRRIDAYFTYPVDMEDWYEASFDDDGDRNPTPKPRARLISRNINPATGKPIKLKLCLYIDVANGGQGDVKIKDMRKNDGVNKTSTLNGAANTPAYDAKGQCVETDDNGVADLVVYDYDNYACTSYFIGCIAHSDKEDAFVHFVVRPVDDISALSCDETSYTLYYGNDKRAGKSAQTGYNSGKTGCHDCCN